MPALSPMQDPEGDGVNDDPHILTPAKIKKRLNEIFPLVDLNGDGQVDRSEMLKRLQIEHTKQEARAKMTLPEHSKAEFAEALEKLDKNTDRMLQFVEIQDDKDVLPGVFTGATMDDKKASFEFADENNDGKEDNAAEDVPKRLIFSKQLVPSKIVEIGAILALFRP